MSDRRRLVHFPREHAVVRRPYVLDFAAWQLRKTAGAVPKVRRLAAMALFGRTGQAGVDPARLERFDRFPGASWMQYATDGSRLLVFNADAQTITKLQLEPNARRLNQEIAIRQRVGAAAPRVVSHDPASGTIVENWMKLAPARPVRATLAAALGVLSASLYKVTVVAARDYVRRFTGVVDFDRIEDFMRTRGVEEVGITEVHGDLWPGNLGIDADGNLILLDWEYARTCARSHDLWTWLAQEWRAAGRAFDRSFVMEFAAAQRTAFSSTCTEAEAEALHLLHLVERYTFFVELGLPHKAEETQFLRGEISALIPS